MKNHFRYSSLQIFIHWISALIIAFVIILPLANHFWANIFSGMGNVYMLHKSFGVLVLLITFCRIIVIKKQGVPDILPKEQKLQHIMAKSVQGCIYLILLLLPISGYLMSNNAINVFNLFSIPILTLSNEFRSEFHFFHILMGYSLIALISLHFIAAIYHKIWIKDKVMQSMLPKRFDK